MLIPISATTAEPSHSANSTKERKKMDSGSDRQLGADVSMAAQTSRSFISGASDRPVRCRPIASEWFSSIHGGGRTRHRGNPEERRGPTVMLRCDQGALPVTEQTQLPYSSEIKIELPGGATTADMQCDGKFRLQEALKQTLCQHRLGTNAAFFRWLSADHGVPDQRSRCSALY